MARATKSAGSTAKLKRKERREEKFGGNTKTDEEVGGYDDEDGNTNNKKKKKKKTMNDFENDRKNKHKSTMKYEKHKENASTATKTTINNNNNNNKFISKGGKSFAPDATKTKKKNEYTTQTTKKVHASSSTQQETNQKQTKTYNEKTGHVEKPNFQLIEDLILIFEKLRQTKDYDNNKEKKREFAEQIFAKTKGKIPEIANNHKGSRIIQSLLKYGTEEQIESVFAECSPKISILAKSLYGNFLIKKLIEKTKKEDYPELLQNIKGQVTSLARHPIGSQILEHLYHSAKTDQRVKMQCEFYGGEFVHFSSQQQQQQQQLSLKDILLKKPTMQRQNTLKNISRSILPILEKGLVSPLIVHKVLKEYLLIGGASLRSEAANSIAAPAFLRLFHTREGATATNVLLSYAGAKQRKAVLKALKTQVWRVSQDECAHSSIMTLIDCVDDTNMLNKIVLQELKKEDVCGVVCEHKFAKRVILHLLRPRVNKYAPPNLQMMMLSPEEIKTSVEAAKELVKTLQKQQKKINRHDNEDDEEEEVAEEEEEEEDDDDDDEEKKATVPEPSAKLNDDDDSDNEDDEETEGADVNFGIAKKSENQRRVEIFKQYGFAKTLVESCERHITEMLKSKESGDVLYEVICGGLDDVVYESLGEDRMNLFYERVAEAITNSIVVAKSGDEEEENLLENFFSTRLLRRASQDCSRFAKVLFKHSICSSEKTAKKKWLSIPHAVKIIAGVLSCSDEKFTKEAKKTIGKDLLAQNKEHKNIESFLQSLQPKKHLK
jgi:pumilio homology domain family member 6